MKIIQLLIAPNDNAWQGRLLGLADDGGVYSPGPSGGWEPELAPIAIPAPRQGVEIPAHLPSLPPIPWGHDRWVYRGVKYASPHAIMVTSFDETRDTEWDPVEMFQTHGDEHTHYIEAVIDHSDICECAECKSEASPPVKAGDAPLSYTGHVPCRKCGTVHWMHGGCPKPEPPAGGGEVVTGFPATLAMIADVERAMKSGNMVTYVNRIPEARAEIAAATAEPTGARAWSFPGLLGPWRTFQDQVGWEWCVNERTSAVFKRHPKHWTGCPAITLGMLERDPDTVETTVRESAPAAGVESRDDALVRLIEEALRSGRMWTEWDKRAVHLINGPLASTGEPGRNPAQA